MFADAIRVGNNLAAAPPGTSASAQAFRGAALPNWAGSAHRDTLEVALACARFRVNSSATIAAIARNMNKSSLSGPSSRKLAWTGGPSSPQSSASSAWRRRLNHAATTLTLTVGMNRYRCHRNRQLKDWRANGDESGHWQVLAILHDQCPQ